uniref:C-terminal of Roc (COR) domain-containing protein n=1 Tax=Chrysotila carterae TaxID=13221 RepID=A0A7S4BYV9_CHRCT
MRKDRHNNGWTVQGASTDGRARLCWGHFEVLFHQNVHVAGAHHDRLVEHLNQIATFASDGPVILVGTRSAEVVGVQPTLAAISDALRGVLASRAPVMRFARFHQVDGESRCFFAVENSAGCDGDETFGQLAQAIVDAARELPSVDCTIPVPWLRVHCELRRRLDEGVRRLPLHQVRSIAKQCGLPHDGLSLEVELEAMLAHFHSLGVIFWLEASHTRELVVLDVQWLLDAMTCLIRNFDLHPMPGDTRAQRAMETEWISLCRSAELHDGLLRYLWANKEFADSKLSLLSTMEHFGLLVSVPGRPVMILPPLLAFGGADALPPMAHTLSECYMHFSLAEQRFPDLLWSPEHFATGFLPKAAFYRIVAASIGWCYNTTAGFDPLLGRNRCDVAFGCSRLSFSLTTGQPVIRVTVRQGKPLEIIDRLRLISRSVLTRFGNLRLRFLIAVPGATNSYVELDTLSNTSSASVMYIDGIPGATTLQTLGTLLGPWLPPPHPPENFDVMLSYRWGPTDSELADALYDWLSATHVGNRAMVVFQDKRRLQDGERFDFAFMRAMLSSRVCCPIISLDALARMVFLDANSPVDNVLLEWSLALHLHEQYGLRVIPILQGPREQLPDGAAGWRITDLFATRPPKLRADLKGYEVNKKGVPIADDRSIFNRVPNVQVRSINERLDEFCSRYNLRLVPNHRTPHQVVHEVTHFLGLLLWQLQSNTSAPHTSRTASGAECWGMYSTVANKILKAVEQVQLGEEQKARI